LAIAWVKVRKWPRCGKSRWTRGGRAGRGGGYEAGRRDESGKRHLRHLLLRQRRRGAITAQTKYGYKAKYGMRSVDEGVTAINEGCNVLGFGFMDKEELGERLVQAWQKKYGA
jgi:hypothetical protein